MEITPAILTNNPTTLKDLINKSEENCERVQIDLIDGYFAKNKTDKIEFIEKVTEVGVGCGLALDLATSVDQIDKSLISNLDEILLMSVPAGFGGQKFDDSVLDKLSTLQKLKLQKNYKFKLTVDGGITFDNIKNLVENGCEEAVIGKSLFEGNVQGNLQKFEEILKK